MHRIQIGRRTLLLRLLIGVPCAGLISASIGGGDSLRAHQVDDTKAMTTERIPPSEVTLSNLEEFRRQITNDLPVGTPKQEVESYFVRWRILYDYFEFEDDRMFLATINDIGKLIVFTASLAIRIPLDAEERVERIILRVDYL